MSIIQVTFNPSIWNGGWTGSAGAPGTSGYDACAVYLDSDGVTAWAFENTFEPNGVAVSGNGFARFRLSDGGIIFQGSLFGGGASGSVSFAGGNNGIDIRFIQDDQGFYYTWYFNGTSAIFTKSHVGASSPSSLWNGYMVLDATWTPSPSVINADANLSATPITPSSDGNRYYVFPNLNGTSSQRGFYVVNVATMALVGQYKDLSINADYPVCFMDKFGDFWMIYEAATGGAGTSSFKFAKWHPADGVSGGQLNVTVTSVNSSPYILANGDSGLGMVGSYVPSSHSVLLGSLSGNSKGGVVNIDLATFTVNATHLNDVSFLYTDSNGNAWVADSALIAQVDAAGSLGIPGAITGSTSQAGGILNVINPTTLALKNTYNLTQLINAQAGLTPVGTFVAPGPHTESVPCLGMQYRNGTLVVVYNTGNDEAHGSPVYILNLAPPPPALSPCVPVDGSGNLINGVYIQDLSLFISPSTALYTNPILPGAINASELKNEGRTSIVLDFNNGDGLYARDLGSVLEWPTHTGIEVYVWQPSIIPMPEATYSRATDWDDAGSPGSKFIQGVIVEAFSFGNPKTFFLQDSDTLTLHTLNECPVTFAKQQEVAFSCSPFVAHSVRLISSDGVEWRIWKSRLVSQPFPELTKSWQTELTSLGMTGWAHAREMNLAYLSTAPVTLTLTFDSIAPIVLTLPSTSGVQAKTKITLPPNKWKLIGFQASSTSPFRVFQGDIEVKLREWGAQGPYGVVKPFGGQSATGATV